jgi:2-iminoacetate synthase ThiH
MAKKQLKDKKYILRRAKNGRRREKHASTALYGSEKAALQRAANRYAQRTLGHRTMSVSAYINIKLLLP